MSCCPIGRALGSGPSVRGAGDQIITDIALDAGPFEHPKSAMWEVKYLFSVIVTMLLSSLQLKWVFCRSATDRGLCERIG